VDYSGLSAFSTAALWAATFAFAFVSGIIPFVLNIELYLLAVAALTDASLVPIVGLSTAGQTLAKYLLYLVGRGSLNIRWVKKAAASKAADAFARRPGGSLTVVAASATIGFPPLYAVALMAGSLRLPQVPFLIIIIIGRMIRFGGVYLIPGLFK
jgi:membrane protein YqaA with SNARE-associated domain